jgi:pyridinium-3,5-biscarboxylic acid mononucleotide sulfurtransferase
MNLTTEKAVALQHGLNLLPSLLVAYSGGVDSAYLMQAAAEVMGPRVRGVMADSPSLPRTEKEEALALAAERGWRVEVLQTHELDNPQYAANPLNRCYFCKHELFQRMEAYARQEKFLALAYGENADDAREFRPGQQAAVEFRILAPLREAGLTKAEIRELSRVAGLPTADKAAQPCLSSRLPTGQPVTRAALAQVEAGEKVLREAGFMIYRLRHLGDRARVQVAPEELVRLQEGRLREALAGRLKSLGFTQVEFDEKPYQGASLR